MYVCCVCLCVCVYDRLYMYTLYLSPIGYKEDDTFRRQMISIAKRKHAQPVKPIVNDIYKSIGTRLCVCVSVKSRFLIYRFKLIVP